jgi:hypothetical protein
MVCKPKKKGGLGILNLKLQNEALLLKYLHKFITGWTLLGFTCFGTLTIKEEYLMPWIQLVHSGGEIYVS